jgi:hypothetical protein
MTQALFLSVLLLVAAPAKKTPQARFAQAQTAFGRGDFTKALKDLDLVAAEPLDASTLSQVHLLRGQCYGAQREVAKAEEAFQQALEYDPEATLDAARVDPTLVALLNGLRERMKGDLEVRTERPAKLWLDNQPLGTSPYKGWAPIGRRTVEAKTADGRYAGSSEVLISARQPTSVDVPLEQVAAPPSAGKKDSQTVQLWGGRPFADLRLGVDFFSLNYGADIEFGAGLEWQYLRASVHFRFFPAFGITPRGGLTIPLMDRLRVFAELELPVLWPTQNTYQMAFGVGGAGGAEYFITKWLSGFAELGARNYFIPGGVALTLQAGVRMRLP